MIEICYALTDRDGKYSKFAGVSIQSILERSSSKIRIHLMHDSTLTRENREKFIELVENFDQRIEFHDLSTLNIESRIRKIFQHEERLRRWSNAAVYRLIAPEILDIEKVIYLDCDILMNLDISELWSIDLENYPIAAKPESRIFPFEIPPEIYQQIDYFKTSPKFLVDHGNIRREDYFNSGVLILNLKKLDKLFDSSLEFLRKYPECIYIDQDPLNFLFSTKYLKLDARFDVFTRQIRKFCYLTNQSIPSELPNWIYHCSGVDVTLDSCDPISKFFLETFLKTPWALDSLQNLFDYAIEFDDLGKSRLQQILNSTRDRIFLTQNHLIHHLTTIFKLRSNDKITNSIDEVLESQNRICIYLFETESETKKIHELLEIHGFKKDLDFFDAREIFTEEQGIKNSTIRFLQKM